MFMLNDHPDDNYNILTSLSVFGHKMDSCGQLYGVFVSEYMHVLFVFRFYGPVNSQGHVEPVSYPLTLFLGRLRPTY